MRWGISSWMADVRINVGEQNIKVVKCEVKVPPKGFDTQGVYRVENIEIKTRELNRNAIISRT